MRIAGWSRASHGRQVLTHSVDELEPEGASNVTFPVSLGFSSWYYPATHSLPPSESRESTWLAIEALSKTGPCTSTLPRTCRKPKYANGRSRTWWTWHTWA